MSGTWCDMKILSLFKEKFVKNSNSVNVVLFYPILWWGNEFLEFVVFNPCDVWCHPRERVQHNWKRVYWTMDAAAVVQGLLSFSGSIRWQPREREREAINERSFFTPTSLFRHNIPWTAVKLAQTVLGGWVLVKRYEI